MKKKVNFSTKGGRADIGPISINRMLPNRYARKIGPFVFLDHVAPVIKEVIHKEGMGAHPHRGIATLTYVMQGEDEHFDSIGNRAKIFSGGVQWMKAGTGIIHDGNMNYDSQTNSKIIHGFQFWINLPAKNKAEKPEYLAVQANDVPQKELPNRSGWIKVILGNYEELSAKIPTYSTQFLYHIHLEAGKQYRTQIDQEIEVAAFLPAHAAVINDDTFDAGELIDFERSGTEIEINNNSTEAIDVLLFGGEEYKEPMVAEGPFVMNTTTEIVQAYDDYHAGKYGNIK
jgi:redox-sensitive bicupin YhaK (pirin superfamily)